MANTEKRACWNCANRGMPLHSNNLNWRRCYLDADWYLADHCCEYWEEDRERDWHCPHCNEYFPLDIDETPNYCPYCGESMDGEDDDNDR